jgi:AcrR family transcriptional regulator
MPKADGYKTKEKIMAVAEQLFAEKGFNGTSIDKIAKNAGVNKGLIYYHFKDKQDIIVSIFRGILKEIDQSVGKSFQDQHIKDDDLSLQQKIRDEIEFCARRRKIISVMLMEALKADGNADFLFQCAEMVIQQEMNAIPKKVTGADILTAENRTRYFLYEFFTGFMPIIAFVSLHEKWSQYFGCDNQKALDYFIEAFTQTHIKAHFAAQ